MKDGENGFLVDYGNIKGFSEKIIKLLDDKKLWSKINKNNLKRAENYRWDLINKRIMKVYEDALGRN